MLSFMSENKRLLNIHERKFAKLSAFQENTNVFQANTNVSLKNLETQVGQLALVMQTSRRIPFQVCNTPNYTLVLLLHV